MTLKAIQRYAGGSMTNGAKMFAVFVEYSCNLAIFARCGVAIDAFLQTVGFGADTFMHGQIALVLEQIHMRGADDIGGLDALLPLGGRYDITAGVSIRTAVTVCSKTAYRPQQQG